MRLIKNIAIAITKTAVIAPSHLRMRLNMWSELVLVGCNSSAQWIQEFLKFTQTKRAS